MRDRLKEIQACLDNRGKAFETLAHRAAFALDPRSHACARDPQIDVHMDFPFQAALQEAVSACGNEYIPLFFPCKVGSQGWAVSQMRF